MFDSLLKFAGRTAAGRNGLLRDITASYFREGRKVAASFAAVLSLPMRGLLKYDVIKQEEYYRELHSLLNIDRAEGYSLTRIGRDNDGGYIMLDDFPGGIAYSFGINDDVSWDKDMAERGYDVYMYDHTIDGLPEENPRFHWSKMGLSDGSSNDSRLKTLEEYIALNGHEGKRDMILKMDVEGFEWGFFETVKPETLTQFSQMTFEFHNMINPAYSERIPNVLRKINGTHQLIHLHANNYAYAGYVSAGGKSFCASIEVSYALREKYRFQGGYDVSLPIEIDMPCARAFPEIGLGHWNRDPEFDGEIFHSPRYRVNYQL